MFKRFVFIIGILLLYTFIYHHIIFDSSVQYDEVQGYCYSNTDLLLFAKVIHTNKPDDYSDDDKINFGKSVLNQLNDKTLEDVCKKYNIKDEVSERSFNIAIKLLNKEI